MAPLQQRFVTLGRHPRRFGSWLGGDAPLFALCLALVVLGVVLRIQDLEFPSRMTWDEDHFIKNCQNYLAGKPDVNDHPPFGKFLLLIGMGIFGDTPTGWRVIPLVSGLANIVLGYFLALSLFRDRRAGWLAAAFIAADGFLLAYSRTALLDGMLTTFMLGVALTAVVARRPWHMLLGSVLLGCAISVKLSGIVMVVPLLVVVAMRRVPWWTLAFLVVAPAIFYAQFAVGHAMTGKEWDPASVIAANRSLVESHLRVDKMAHPKASNWYTWFLPTRPVTLRVDVIREPLVRVLSTMGNPLLWWTASITVLVTLAGLIWWSFGRGVSKVRRHVGGSSGFFQEKTAAIAWLLLFWALPLTPWILTSRDSYIYHYLPSYCFALVLVGGIGAWLCRRRRMLVFVGTLLIAEVTVFYAPVWAQLPVTRLGMQQRLFFQTWR